MTQVWLRPAIGLWLGLGQGSKDSKGGNAGFVFGDFVVKLGLLFGLNLGFGEKWGFFTGLVGAISLIPLFTIGFIGVPLGFHYKKKIGIGIVIPVVEVDPLIALAVGASLFIIGLLITVKKKEILVQ